MYFFSTVNMIHQKEENNGGGLRLLSTTVDMTTNIPSLNVSLNILL